MSSTNNAPQRKSALNIVMGAMTFGAQGTSGARVHDLKQVEAILDVFHAHGHTEIDTARVYAGGTSEEFLGKIDLQAKGFKLETKLYPSGNLPAMNSDTITHSPEDLRKHLLASLKALNVESIEMWYLHAPDRNVPYDVTMKAVNELYEEGYFKRFGLSNYAAWEVAEIVGICNRNGFIKPTAYQGVYNVVHRSVEPELLPCLRKFSISFYEFNPLGGGMFTGRYTSSNDLAEPGSRFDDEKAQGKMYRERYWKEQYFQALSIIRAAAEAQNLTMPEVALRWISHHSQLSRKYDDAVLIGASSLKHIEQNLVDLEKGPLPDNVVQACDQAWEIVKPIAANYFR